VFECVRSCFVSPIIIVFGGGWVVFVIVLVIQSLAWYIIIV